MFVYMFVAPIWRVQWMCGVPLDL